MILKEKLNEALQNKENDINSFVWKGKKFKVGNKFEQDVIKLVDATPDQLKEFYNYCITMLNNTSKTDPGRNLVLQLIQDQRERCNVELFLRSMESLDNTSRYALNEKIQKVLTELNVKSNELILGQISENCPNEFKNISLNLIIDGCMDKLGAFNRKHLTLTLILKQGVWLTPQEMDDLTEKDHDGNIKNRLDVIRERLNIDKNIIFNINSKGLSYSQLRAVLQLKSKKYSEMTSEQLKILRNRILFNLENDVKYHIKQWETRMQQIEKVAKSRNIKL